MKKHIKIVPLMIAIFTLFLFSTAFTTASVVTFSGTESLTRQIWAVSVEADPGHSGSIGMNFEAAYGDPATIGDDDYVGNYFNIDQHAYTSSGVTKRYIDISSPESHGFLNEAMTVVGMADVRESFSMNNIPAGSGVDIDWFNLF
jgi:hypothetical protein